MNVIKDILEVKDLYDSFIFDIWGVIHDGDELYPNVLSVFSELKLAKKQVTLLSNAPRRASKAEIVLNKFGINNSHFDSILTSGEAVYKFLEGNESEGYSEYGRNFFYIGPEKDRDLLEGLNYNMVDDYKMADFAIVTGFDDNEKSIDDKKQLIDDIFKNHKIKFICANPDLIVVKKDGRTLPCAGQIAKYYEELGGEVLYFGKPYEAVYNRLFNSIISSDRDKVLVIGDGLETDIKGANNQGIDSVFITSGILSSKLGNKLGELPDSDKLNEEFKLNGANPNFVMTNL